MNIWFRKWQVFWRKSRVRDREWLVGIRGRDSYWDRVIKESASEKVIVRRGLNEVRKGALQIASGRTSLAKYLRQKQTSCVPSRARRRVGFPFLFSISAHSFDDVIQSQGFKYHLYTFNSYNHIFTWTSFLESRLLSLTTSISIWISNRLQI